MEIGVRLKEARIANDISLESLQETTKIQKRYLLAIEQGNLHLLPGKFYARAFIKEYATAVGLDPDELLKSYQEESTSEDEEHHEQQYSRIQRSRQDGRTSKNPAIMAFVPKIIVALLVIGIIVAAMYFYQKQVSNDGQEDMDQQESDEIIRTKKNPNESPTDDENIDKDSNDQEDKDEKNEDEDDQDKDSEDIERELKLIETGTGNRPESIFELHHSDEKVMLILKPTGVSWVDIKNDQDQSLLGVNTSADTPIELDITDESRVRINIGNTSELPVILINDDIELEYPTDKMTQSFWININNSSE